MFCKFPIQTPLLTPRELLSYTFAYKKLSSPCLWNQQCAVSCRIAAHSPRIIVSKITGAAKGMRWDALTALGTSLAHKSAVECALAAAVRRFDGAGGSSFILHARTHAFHFSLENYRPALGLNKKERYARRALSTRLWRPPEAFELSPSQCSRARAFWIKKH